MIDRPHRRLHGADRGVTTHAGWTRTLKLAAGMTAITAHVRMRSIELKPGAEMIERLLCRCGREECSKQQPTGREEESPWYQ